MDRHGGRDGRRALPADFPLRRMGCGARPGPNCLAASGRRAACAGISQRGPAALSHRFIVVVTLTSSVVLGAVGHFHQHRLWTYISPAIVEIIRLSNTSLFKRNRTI